MQMNVGHRTGGDLRRLHRLVEYRLIDVDPGNVMVIEKADELLVLKRSVANFEGQRVTVERAKELLQLLLRLRGVLETPRVLKQDRAEAIGIHQGIEVIAKRFDLLRAELRLLMGKTAEDLRGELEIGVGRHPARPAFRVRGRRDAVERRIDLDRVEK